MLVIWCVNGLAQAFLWPPLVRLMSTLFSGVTYQQAVVAVTWGGSLGNIALYLAAPALLPFTGVKGVFFMACLCGGAAALVLRHSCPAIQTQPVGPGPKPDGKNPLLLPLVWAVLLAIILQGMLRDGITTWMPVYIDQTFRLGSSFSIFSGTALPLFSLAAIQGPPGSTAACSPTLSCARARFLAWAPFAAWGLPFSHRPTRRCLSGFRRCSPAVCMA